MTKTELLLTIEATTDSEEVEEFMQENTIPDFFYGILPAVGEICGIKITIKKEEATKLIFKASGEPDKLRSFKSSLNKVIEKITMTYKLILSINPNFEGKNIKFELKQLTLYAKKRV